MRFFSDGQKFWFLYLGKKGQEQEFHGEILHTCICMHYAVRLGYEALIDKITIINSGEGKLNKHTFIHI